MLTLHTGLLKLMRLLTYLAIPWPPPPNAASNNAASSVWLLPCGLHWKPVYRFKGVTNEIASPPYEILIFVVHNTMLAQLLRTLHKIFSIIK